MAFVITDACIDVKDRTCINECPVDCIYEGGRKLYINPEECIDCGACEPICPVEAIYPGFDLPEDKKPFADSDARFFAEPLHGRTEAIGAPGGSTILGAVNEDTELVAGWPRQTQPE
jgi:NAD-dependent dihydropyrimidine dehydrogenase PreA subunit